MVDKGDSWALEEERRLNELVDGLVEPLIQYHLRTAGGRADYERKRRELEGLVRAKAVALKAVPMERDSLEGTLGDDYKSVEPRVEFLLNAFAPDKEVMRACESATEELSGALEQYATSAGGPSGDMTRRWLDEARAKADRIMTGYLNTVKTRVGLLQAARRVYESDGLERTLDLLEAFAFPLELEAVPSSNWERDVYAGEILMLTTEGSPIPLEVVSRFAYETAWLHNAGMTLNEAGFMAKEYMVAINAVIKAEGIGDGTLSAENYARGVERHRELVLEELAKDDEWLAFERAYQTAATEALEHDESDRRRAFAQAMSRELNIEPDKLAEHISGDEGLGVWNVVGRYMTATYEPLYNAEGRPKTREEAFPL